MRQRLFMCYTEKENTTKERGNQIMECKQNKGRRGMDMLHGSIADKLFFFAMPIGLMGLFEQLFNSADVFILGRFVGKSAMAAVGNNMPVIGILVTLLMGISLGANVTIAQYLGARRDDKVERTVQTAILMSFGLGVLLAIIGELIVYPAFWVLEVPPDVYDMAEQYLRIFLLGLPFLSLYNFEAAIFRSCGDGKTPLYSLIAANLVNIVFDLLSVLVFDFGLAGVVWATVLAFAVNSLILLALLCRTTDRIRLERHHMRFSREELHHIIHIGLPAGIQGMVFALSNVLIQSALNSLGTEAMARRLRLSSSKAISTASSMVSASHDDLRRPELRRPQLAPLFPHYEVAFGVEAAFLLVVTVPVLFFSPDSSACSTATRTSSPWGRNASFTSPGPYISTASSTSFPAPCAAMAIPCRRLSSSWPASAASALLGCTPCLRLTATSWSSWRPIRPAGWSRPSS